MAWQPSPFSQIFSEEQSSRGRTLHENAPSYSGLYKVYMPSIEYVWHKYKMRVWSLECHFQICALIQAKRSCLSPLFEGGWARGGQAGRVPFKYLYPGTMSLTNNFHLELAKLKGWDLVLHKTILTSKPASSSKGSQKPHPVLIIFLYTQLTESYCTNSYPLLLEKDEN